jgi:Cyclophilin type peptidyl-prolyl cis-trans isomerase/CLD
MIVIALFNGYFVYPYIKHYYRKFNSLRLPRGDPTHFCYIDLELDGKDIGRLDFELFGTSSPKTVNNFLGFITGDFDPYQRYKNTYLQRIYE